MFTPLLVVLVSAASLGRGAASVLRAGDLESQGCDVGVSVDFPFGQDPSVTCTAQCYAENEETWFVGSTFRKVAGLTERGLMVEIKYNKDAMVDCRLVAMQPESDILKAFESCEVGQPSDTAPTGDNLLGSSTVIMVTETTIPAETTIPTGTNTGTFIPTGTNTGTIIPTGTNTGTFIPTGTNTGTIIPTETNIPTGTFIPTGTNTGTFIPTGTNTGTFIPTGTNTGTFIPTGTNTGTIIPTGTNTGTFIPTETNIPTGTNTGTFIPTETNIPTGTNTGTIIPTETTILPGTNTGTFIPTGTNTGTFIPTGTNTGTFIPTETTIPTGTNTGTIVPTGTNTGSSGTTAPTEHSVGTTIIPDTTTQTTEVVIPETTTLPDCGDNSGKNGHVAEKQTTPPETTTPPPTTTTRPPPTTTKTPTTTRPPTTTPTPTTTTTLPPTTTALSCPEGWAMYDRSCYHVSSERGTWTEGKSYCESNGGSFVTLTSEEEWDFVKSMTVEDTWIGLNDRNREGAFVWDSDNTSPAFTMFSSGEPNDHKPFLWSDGEDCVELRESKDFLWNDDDCDKDKIYACERSPFVSRG
ncbi:putative per-hexamer repeat protein 5 isoform X10 [Penaeus japonicus]|uniref:putative per-hexamer repeat protein 5 isoform X10 n=1 Tax=Penaeus japonicus TaxID=27405 RepID=UPI001C710623|nr:putative per-hexamer repeat protein 5 isoform X10 [Penaeus japonicus]